jgi:hypothetical protein
MGSHHRVPLTLLWMFATVVSKHTRAGAKRRLGLLAQAAV